MRLKFVSLLLLMVLLSSCLSTKVVTDVPYQKNGIEEVVLLPVMIERIWQPAIPLIDASAFNGKTNKIADQLTSYHEEVVMDLETSLLSQSQQVLGFNMRTVSSLEKEQLEVLQKMHLKRALYSDHNHYPKTVSSYTEFNPFDLRDGKLEKYFSDDINYQRVGKDVCQALDVDAVMISFSRLVVTGVTMFGGSGDIRMETYIMMVDRSGLVRGKSKGFTKPIREKGKVLQDYKNVWQQHPNIIKLTLLDLRSPKQN